MSAWGGGSDAELERALTRLRYEGKVSFRRNVHDTLNVLRRLDGHAHEHTELQERVIFPYVTRRMPRLGPLTRLFSHEHQDLRRGIRHLRRALRGLESRGSTAARGQRIARLFQEGSELALAMRLHEEGERAAFLQRAWDHFRPDEKKEFLDRVGSWLIIKKHAAPVRGA